MKFLKKNQKKTIIKFFNRKETQLTLAGIGGIALYKTFEVIGSCFPELISIVEDLVSDEGSASGVIAESSDVQDAVI